MFGANTSYVPSITSHKGSINIQKFLGVEEPSSRRTLPLLHQHYPRSHHMAGGGKKTCGMKEKLRVPSEVDSSTSTPKIMDVSLQYLAWSSFQEDSPKSSMPISLQASSHGIQNKGQVEHVMKLRGVLKDSHTLTQNKWGVQNYLGMAFGMEVVDSL